MKNIFNYTLVAIITFLSSCEKIPEDSNGSFYGQSSTELNSKFNVSKAVVEINEIILFNNNSANAQSYLWDFGDGNTSEEINPNHAYSQEGTYIVKCTAIGSKDKDQDISTMSITVKHSKFIGTYAMQESYTSDSCSSSSNLTYSMIIRKGSSDNQLIIDNLQDKFLNVKANLSESGDELTIYSQSVKDNRGNTWSINSTSSTSITYIGGAIAFIYLFSDLSYDKVCGMGDGTVQGINLTDVPDIVNDGATDLIGG